MYFVPSSADDARKDSVHGGLARRLDIKLTNKRLLGGMVVAAFAILLTLLAGCSGMGEEHDENVPRLAQNRPTNVDLKHDLPVPRDKILYMEVDFAQHNQAEHDALSGAIDDKKSPLYHPVSYTHLR